MSLTNPDIIISYAASRDTKSIISPCEAALVLEDSLAMLRLVLSNKSTLNISVSNIHPVACLCMASSDTRETYWWTRISENVPDIISNIHNLMMIMGPACLTPNVEVVSSILGTSNFKCGLGLKPGPLSFMRIIG